MVRFAHLSDVHLGGWKQKPMQELNFESFKKAIDVCLKSNLDFVLIAGDLFDSAYPPIEILKEAFGQFKRLNEARIPCYIIAGSHDYSVSGKSFLDVLEKAGFCKNVYSAEEKEDKILLHPVIHENVAIYGYPGKKSGLEIPDIRKLQLNDSPGMFKIFMLHTTLDKAKGTLPIDAVECDCLPKVDYYALGHLHIDFQYENFIYPGPIFPNNFQELQDLHHGSFYIVDTKKENFLEKVELKVRDIIYLDFEVNDAISATERIISELDKKDLKDKVILLRLYGRLENSSNSDIKYNKIEEFVSNKGAYFMIKNTHDLKAKETDLDLEISGTQETETIEDEAIKSYSKQNPSDFNKMIPQLMESLSIEKQEGETTESFTSKILEESKKIMEF